MKMTWKERKKSKEETIKKIKEMNDTQKLEYIVNLLKTEGSIEMFTDCSDTYGINFTEEYDELQEKIEVFLNAIK